MQYGPQAALIAETFPTQIRYSGAGLGYQLASLVAGGPAPLIATWLLHDYGPYAVATYLALSALVSIAALTRLPERSQVELSALDTAASEARGPGARNRPVKPHRPLRATGPATRRRVRSRGSASSSPRTPLE